MERGRFDLGGMTILVTGGAGHIGAAMSRELARHGADLLILDKTRPAAEALATELQTTHGVRAAALIVDLADTEALAGVAETAAGTTGRLDVVINNAAFYESMPGWGVPLEQESPAAWQAVLNVNCLAPFFLVQGLLPLLRRSDRAAVINIASTYGLVGPVPTLYAGTDMVNPCAYAVSKGGLLQMTRWLATALAPDIRVNAISPGGVERGQPEAFQDRYTARTPLGRMATEEDLVGAALFLASPAAGYVTGQNIVIDGGWTAW